MICKSSFQVKYDSLDFNHLKGVKIVEGLVNKGLRKIVIPKCVQHNKRVIR